MSGAYPGSGVKPSRRHLSRVVQQTVPLRAVDRERNRSASRSFVVDDYAGAESPKFNIESYMNVANTRQRARRSEILPQNDNGKSSDQHISAAPRVMQLTENERRRSSRRVSSPGSRRTPRTNLFNLMHTGEEKTPAERTMEISQTSTPSASLSSEIHFGQEVSISPISMSRSEKNDSVKHKVTDRRGTRRSFHLNTAKMPTDTSPNLDYTRNSGQRVSVSPINISETSEDVRSSVPSKRAETRTAHSSFSLPQTTDKDQNILEDLPDARGAEVSRVSDSLAGVDIPDMGLGPSFHAPVMLRDDDMSAASRLGVENTSLIIGGGTGLIQANNSLGAAVTGEVTGQMMLSRRRKSSMSSQAVSINSDISMVIPLQALPLDNSNVSFDATDQNLSKKESRRSGRNRTASIGQVEYVSKEAAVDSHDSENLSNAIERKHTEPGGQDNEVTYDKTNDQDRHVMGEMAEEYVERAEESEFASARCLSAADKESNSESPQRSHTKASNQKEQSARITQHSKGRMVNQSKSAAHVRSFNPKDYALETTCDTSHDSLTDSSLSNTAQGFFYPTRVEMQREATEYINGVIKAVVSRCTVAALRGVLRRWGRISNDELNSSAFSGQKLAICTTLQNIAQRDELTREIAGDLELSYIQLNSTKKLWRVFKLKGEGLKLDIDPRTLRSKLVGNLRRKKSDCVVDSNMSLFAGALWLRVHFHVTRFHRRNKSHSTKDKHAPAYEPSSSLFLLFYPSSPVFIMSKSGVKNSMLVLQAVKELTCAESWVDTHLSGQHVASLADLALCPQKQPGHKFRDLERRENPLVAKTGSKRKSPLDDTSFENEPHILDGTKQEKRQRKEVLVSAFGAGEQPLLEKLEYKFEVPGDNSKEENSNYKVLVEVKGKAVLDGLCSLASKGFVKFPLPNHFSAVVRRSQNSFSLKPKS